MKNLNLKPLYIFLAIVGVAFIFKFTQPEKEINATRYDFEKTGPYVNSFEKEMHENGGKVKEGIYELKKEAAKNEMDVVIPTYNQ